VRIRQPRRPPTSMPASAAPALRSMEAISALGHALSSAERLRAPEDRRRGGPHHWPTVRRASTVGRGRVPGLVRILDVLAREPVERAVHVLRIAAAVPLLVPGTPPGVRAGSSLVLAGSAALLAPRQHYGSDGSDQVAILTQTACALARIAPRHAESIVEALAVQAVLSYGASALGKLAGAEWRTGTAVPSVLRTATFGEERASRWVDRSSRIGRILTWGVLLAEAAAPAALVVPPRVASGIVVLLRGFHGVNAAVMGLNRFTFSFSALHPALVHVSAGAHARRAPVGRLAVASACAVVGAAASSAAVQHAIRRREHGLLRAALRRPPVGPDPLRGGRQRTGPVVLIEPDIGETGTDVRGLVRLLRERGIDAAQADRAGFGDRRGMRPAAGPGPAAAASLRSASLPRGRPVVVVGFGYGALVVGAMERERAVAHTVLVDPMLVGDWRAHAPDLHARATGRVVDMGLTEWTLRAGGGPLRVTPPELRTLSREDRGTIRGTDRDPAVWAASRRELGSAIREDATLAGLLVPGRAATVLMSRQSRLASPHLARHWQAEAVRAGSSFASPPWLPSARAALAPRGGSELAELIVGICRSVGDVPS